MLLTKAKNPELIRLRRYSSTLAVLLTLVLVLSMLWTIKQQKHEAITAALAEGKAIYQKDIIFRRWASLHGGVYVPISERTPPSPYLSHIEERDLTTPSGKRLTLMNPAYMIRQLHEVGKKDFQIEGHLTSLKPIRPENLPDEWERKALLRFEKGAHEFSELTTIDGEEHLRMMLPVLTEASCLQCHAHQGYQVGDIRGGIAVKVPMAPYLTHMKGNMVDLTWIHLGFWIPGLAGIFTGQWRLEKVIHKRLQTESQLRLSEARLAKAQQMAHIGNWEWDLTTDLIFLSDESYRIYDLSVAEFSLRMNDFLSFVHSEDQKSVQQVFAAAVQQKIPFEIRHRIISQKGTERYLHVLGEVISDSEGQAVNIVGTVQDISQMKILEEQLQRSRLLEATGKLAASVAHEINSPLQGIISILNVVSQTNKENETLLEHLDLIRESFMRISQIVKSLLDLNRPATSRKQTVNINNIIEQTTSLTRTMLSKESIALNLELAPQLPQVCASPQQLGQVLMNLINNAFEAIKESPSPEEGSDNLPSAQKQIKVETMLRGEEIIIKVSDNGPGIAREDIEHIFDPFYTSKKAMGVGIGLALCHGIIKDHNGSLEAQNLATGGAVFTITLKASDC